ncbi:MAG: hypothetical protein Q8S13_03060 [Dehalococcoidia bacterium]|nr:hypothetical protein [Dehalococcoidia bacterium]
MPGNLTCGEVRHDLIEAPKIEPVVSGTTSFSVQGATHSVTITNVQDSRFDWSSTIGITVVVVKGGPNANVYTYDAGSLGDTGLHAPISPNTGQPYGLSHASLCYGGAAGVPGAGEQPAPEGPVLQPPGAEVAPPSLDVAGVTQPPAGNVSLPPASLPDTGSGGSNGAAGDWAGAATLSLLALGAALLPVALGLRRR